MDDDAHWPPADEGALEQRVRALLQQDTPDAACAAVLEGLGPEIGVYLAQIADTPDQGGDAFSAFAEDVWRGLPGFRFEASLRTWCYVIARRALSRERRQAQRQRRRQVPLSALGPASRIAADVREQTVTWKKTAVKDKVRALREQLKPEERELLTLRIDRQLAFNTIAQMMADAELSADDERKQAASLRKRFERLKRRVRELAAQEGLL